MSGFTVRLYRYHPEQDEVPYSQDVEVDDEFRNRMAPAGHAGDSGPGG